MNVRELIEMLQHEDPDALVVVSGDDFRPPRGEVTAGVYCADTDALCNPVGYGSFQTDINDLSVRYEHSRAVRAVRIS